MKKQLMIGLMTLSAVTLSAQAISVELGLAIDGSGSISSGNFTLQKNAYAAAIAAEVPIDGSVAIGVWQFGSSVSQVFAVTTISSLADRNNLIAAINGMVQDAGSTALGPAIQTAATAILGNSITSNRQVIDVSTDGFGNVGIDQVTARDNALAAGIDQINGLLIGAGASGTFVGGTGSFTTVAANFTAFQVALENKLRTEIQGGVPDAGGTFALMSLSLLGLMGVRRAMRLA